ncbi:MAG: hypothetical protein LLG04_01015, partial [Parachlamydia sp.]|nr:hypothetical protein [Parachlamydia sp.]
DQFTRENLTQEVKDLTGLEIHAPENYPHVKRFQQAILFAVQTLQQTYEGAKSPDDQLRFFCHGLGANLIPTSCFEARTEAMFHYGQQIQTLTGLLRFEIHDLNRQKGVALETPVALREINAFFKDHPAHDEAVQEAIEELRKQDLIASDQPQNPQDSIHEAYSLYENFGSGLVPFLNYLAKYPKCSKWDARELANHVANYFDKFPERKSFL